MDTKHLDKEAKTAKRSWQKPELIVLARSRSEEMVLASCKVSGMGGPNSRTCDNGQGPGSCRARVTS